MDWQIRLITIFVEICELWEEKLQYFAQRFSHNQNTDISDTEVITILLFCISEHHLKTVKDIHNFASQHLIEWFPCLGKYEAFNKRLNFLSDVFPALCESIIYRNTTSIPIESVVDSMPIILAKSKRSQRAKVSPELASKGFCSSKGEYFYGLKLHVVGSIRPGKIPSPTFIGISAGADHDLQVFKQVIDTIRGKIYADKAYCEKDIEEKYSIITPVKRKKGGRELDYFEKLYSTSVSRIRQPIESFFNWLNEITSIQMASKVRSSKGLMVHIFGRIAAALMVMNY